MGKSSLGAMVILCELAMPGRQIAIIGQEFRFALKEFEYVYKGFQQLFGWGAATKHEYKNTTGYYRGVIQTLWGSSVQIYSAQEDQGQSLLGEEFDLVVVGEAGIVPAEVVDTKVQRALLGRAKKDPITGYVRDTGRLCLFSTPKGFFGALSSKIDEVDKITGGRQEKLQIDYGTKFAESVYVEFADVLENPSYSRENYETARATLPPESFAEQFQGKRVFRSGLIYNQFDPEKHVVPFPGRDEVDKMRLAVGFDPGQNAGFCVVGLDFQHRVWVLGEIYDHEVISTDTLAKGESMIEAIAGSKDRIELWYFDTMSQQKELLRNFTPHPWLDEKFELLGTIDELHSLMAQGRFLITSNCVETLKQISKYRWKQPASASEHAVKNTKAEPLKTNDHLLDAIRYATIPLLRVGAMPTIGLPQTYEQMMTQWRAEMESAKPTIRQPWQNEVW